MIAVAAYSYMSLVPLIQPPIMKLLTTQKEREVTMEQLRPVTKRLPPPLKKSGRREVFLRTTLTALSLRWII